MTDSIDAMPHTALQDADTMLFDSSLDGMLMVDCASGTILRSNSSVERLLGYSQGELAGQSYTILFPPDSSSPLVETSNEVQTHDTVFRQAFRRSDGTALRLDLTAVMVSSQDRDLILVTLRDTREREAHERRIVDAARIDALTGLYSRTELMRRLELEHLRALRYNISYSVCFVDLDSYKAVNDEHGHMVGDAVLKAFARALTSELRANDIAGRYGGDEIVVVFPHTDASTAFSVVERIRRRIAACPLRAGRAVVSVTASFGIAGAQPGIEAVGQVLERADRALYEAKQHGRNRTCIDENAIASPEREGPDRRASMEPGHGQ